MNILEIFKPKPIIRTEEENAAIREKARTLLAQGKEPITIKVWRHSFLGEFPRKHHMAMHNKGVPDGMNFILTNENGEIISTPYPCDKSLPKSETTECRCSVVHKVIFATKEEIAEIRSHASDTGGYSDERWKLS